MFKEFKEFAIKGNAFDLAVGVIIGAAFGSIVSSLVNDIIMPPIGLITGHVDFANLFVSLHGHYQTIGAAKAAGAPTINYGLFLNNVVDFLIVAFVIFLVVRQISRMRKKEEAPAPVVQTKKVCPFCATEIPLQAIKCPACTSDLR